MNGILYWTETSAKSGKNVELLFTDCAKFIYQKFRERMDYMGNDGDLSSDGESSFDNSLDNTGHGGSFKESRGHKAGRKRSRRKLRSKSSKK